VIDVSLTVSPIRNEKGTVIGGSKILRDIRDRKAAEAALVEKEKFAAAGRLAATLAHEVNNPLESITNLAYLLTQNDSLDADAKSYAELLLKEVQRAGDITRATLGYYRQSKAPSDVNLQQVVEHVLHAKRKKLDEKSIGVEINFRGTLEVRGFAGELRQVFDNLIDNAIDAVPLDGRIVVNARMENNRVVVRVCDNGSGISSEFMPHIFDPFFTTKSEKGSGLGLWVSRSIVEKHGGSIRVQCNRDPHETVFTVELPLEGVERDRVVASTGVKIHAAI
jgi:signal transduction histidine kinase